MPTSQSSIELYTSTTVSELLDSDLSPYELLKRFSESVPDIILAETQMILQPNPGYRLLRSVIEGNLQELSDHPTMIDDKGEVTLVCAPKHIEALYVVVSSILRLYPGLDHEESKYKVLHKVLHQKMLYFGFLGQDEGLPDLSVSVELEPNPANKES